MLAPASFLTFGNDQRRPPLPPPQTDIFLGRGVPPHLPPLIFVTRPASRVRWRVGQGHSESCTWLWEDWASEVRTVRGSQHTGQVGPTRLPDGHDEHRAIAEALWRICSAGAGPVSLRSAEACRRDLRGVDGVRTRAHPLHLWTRTPAGGAQVGSTKHASRVERQYREVNVLPRLEDTHKALLRSQSGPMAGACALSCADVFPQAH